jgi:hypothetical protein
LTLQESKDYKGEEWGEKRAMTTIKREELHEIIMLAVNHKRDRCYIKHVLGLNYGSIYIYFLLHLNSV